MKPILETEGQLVWRQTSAIKRDSELLDQRDLCARLDWQSSFKAAATVQTSNDHWKMKLEGFVFRQWISIDSFDGDRAVGLFQAQPSFNGALELPSGAVYNWESNFWLTKWIWSDPDGQDLVRVDRNLSLKTEGVVEITPDGYANADVPLLVVLGWYLIVLVTDLRPG